MSIPNQYDNTDFGKKSKVVLRKVSTEEKGGTRKKYGSKAILTKEDASISFKDFLINEAKDVTLLPDRVISELKKLIRDGAKDLAQNWKNALHLVHTAYHVGGVRRPVPDEKGAWKQYEELIKFGVKQLSSTRGLDGEWRSSTVLVREADEVDQQQGQQDPGYEMVAPPQAPTPRKPSLQSMAQQPQDNPIGKRRFFVEIPGQSAAEIDGQNMDEIIEMMTNKLRRHGTKVRVESRDKVHAVISVWYNDVKRDEIIIKEVS